MNGIVPIRLQLIVIFIMGYLQSKDVKDFTLLIHI